MCLMKWLLVTNLEEKMALYAILFFAGLNLVHRCRANLFCNGLK